MTVTNCWCSICGRPHHYDHRCPEKTLARLERERREFGDDDPGRVFDNCNVCGRKLHTADEDKAGVCVVCANE